MGRPPGGPAPEPGTTTEADDPTARGAHMARACPPSGVSMKSVKTVVFLCALGLAVPGTALAAGPTGSTGGATAVTPTTATLNGTVDPNHNATIFHFEYGRNTRYGSRTPDAGT